MFRRFFLFSLAVFGFVIASFSGATVVPPFFASIKADEANMRAGPGKNYPIIWVYKRRYLPMKVLAHREDWWQVADEAGEMGWMHGSLLSKRRTAFLRYDTKAFPAPTAEPPAIAILQKGVVGELLACAQLYCELRLDNLVGWVDKKALWGAE